MLKTGFYEKVTQLEAQQLEEGREEREARMAEVSPRPTGSAAADGGRSIALQSVLVGLRNAGQPAGCVAMLSTGLPWPQRCTLSRAHPHPLFSSVPSWSGRRRSGASSFACLQRPAAAAAAPVPAAMPAAAAAWSGSDNDNDGAAGGQLLG